MELAEDQEVVNLEDLCRNQFRESLVRITQSLLRFLLPPSPVLARWREDTTLTQRLSVRPSMYAGVMAVVASLSSASFAQMEPSSNKSI